MTQPRRQSRQPVQHLHEPTVMVLADWMSRRFAGLYAKLAVETGCHGQA